MVAGWGMATVAAWDAIRVVGVRNDDVALVIGRRGAGGAQGWHGEQGMLSGEGSRGGKEEEIGGWRVGLGKKRKRREKGEKKRKKRRSQGGPGGFRPRPRFFFFSL